MNITEESNSSSLGKPKSKVVYDLVGLPKISLNQWYAGKHWTERAKIKDIYSLLLKKYKKVDYACECEYSFTFKSHPLDASNCVAMVKMIEDVLLVKDKWDIVTKLTITSKKGKEDKVVLQINQI